MLMHYEIEQKFAIADRTALEERLRSLGAKELGQVEQADQYFNHPARDFAQTDEALRIRRVGRASFVTYKGPKLDQTTKSRRELELPLGSDETTAVQFAEMLVALGFRPVAEVRKSRREFEAAWNGRQIEVALDDVAGLGWFAELEISIGKLCEPDEIEQAKASIAGLAAAFGLEQNERRSYLELLLEKR